MDNFSIHLSNMFPEKRLYLLQSLPTHLADAGQTERLRWVLSDFEFMEAKVKALGPQMLIGDYELSGEGPLRFIQNALRREAYILTERPDLLWQQLCNRLQWAGEAVVQVLLAEVKRRRESATFPWLRLKAPLRESQALIRTIRANVGAFYDCVPSPDGTLVGTAGGDGTLQLWDIQTGQQQAVLPLHINDNVQYAWAMSPDGTWIVSSSDGHDLVVRDTQTMQERAILRGDSSNINACRISPDGSFIVSVSDDTLTVWEAQVMQKRAILGHHGISSFAIHPDCSFIVSCGRDGPGETDPCTHIVWDIQTGQNRTTLRGHDGNSSSCTFSPDGSFFVSWSLGDDGTIKVWNTQTWQEHATVSDAAAQIHSCVFSSDSSYMVTAYGSYLDGNSNILTVWETQTWTWRALRQLHGHAGPVRDCVICSDGSFLVSASEDGTLKVWDTKTWQERTTLLGHGFSVNHCAVTSDGSYILSTSSDKTLKVWDVLSMQQGSPQPGHTGAVTACAISPDGSYIVSASDDKTLKVWDAQTLQEQATIREHTGAVTACAISPDGSYIVSASDDKTLKVWDAQTLEGRPTFGLTITKLQGHAAPINACAISPDGSFVASASPSVRGNDNTVVIWKAWDGLMLATLRDHTAPIKACTISPDGSFVASLDNNGVLQVRYGWTKRRFVAHGGRGVLSSAGEYDTCVISPDSSFIFAGSSAKQSIAILNARTLEEQAILDGFTGAACTVSPDGTWVVASSDDSTLKIWDIQTGKEKAILRGHSGFIRSCLVSPDGAFIVSLSADATLRVWDSQTGQELATLPLPGISLPQSMALHPWCPFLVCGDVVGNVYFVELVGITYGPLFMTAIEKGNSLEVCCPKCRRITDVSNVQLGREFICPQPECRMSLHINTFTTSIRSFYKRAIPKFGICGILCTLVLIILTKLSFGSLVASILNRVGKIILSTNLGINSLIIIILLGIGGIILKKSMPKIGCGGILSILVLIIILTRLSFSSPIASILNSLDRIILSINLNIDPLVITILVGVVGIMFSVILSTLNLEIWDFLKDTNEWTHEAGTHFRAKRYEEALVAYEQARKRDIWHSRLPGYGKVLILAILKRYEEALTAFEQAFSLIPPDAPAFYNKGIILTGLERYEEALAAFEQAIALDHNLIRAYDSQGFVLVVLEQYEKALTAFEQAIVLAPNDAKAYDGKGMVLFKLNRYDEALAAFEQAILLDPSLESVYMSKDSVLASLKRYEEALAPYEQTFPYKSEGEEAVAPTKIQQQEAESRQQTALAHRLATQALEIQAELPAPELWEDHQFDLLERSVLLAIESMQRFPSVEADQALRCGMEKLPRCFAILPHHYGVKSMALSPDGRLLATGTASASDLNHNLDAVTIWDVRTARIIASLPQGKINNLAFSHDGNLLVIERSNVADLYVICVLEIATGRLLTSPFQTRSGRFQLLSPDGQTIVTEVYTSNVWETRTGRHLKSFYMPSIIYRQRGGLFATVSDGRTVRVWEFVSGHLVVTSLLNEEKVDMVAFSPDESLLATSNRLGMISIWRIPDGEQVASWSCGYAEYGNMFGMIFSSNGGLLATPNGANTIDVWEIATGSRLASLSCRSVVVCAAFSPCGTLLATASSDHTTRIWGIKNARCLAVLPHQDNINALAFSPDGRLLVTISDDRTAGIWEIPLDYIAQAEEYPSGHRITSLYPQGSIRSIAFSPDGGLLTATGDDHTARVWEIKTGLCLAIFPYQSSVDTVAFSSNAALLAAVGADHTIKVWEIESGNQLATLPHHNGVEAIVFSPDGRLLTTTSNDQAIRVWEIKTGLCLTMAPCQGNIRRVMFDPTGQLLVAIIEGYGLVVGETDSESTVILWEVLRSHPLVSLSHEGKVKDVTFSSDGRILTTITRKASPSENYTVDVLEASSGRQIVSLFYHEEVNAVAVSPGGHLLAIGSGDRTEVRETQDGVLLFSLLHESPVRRVAFSPDGSFISSVSGSGTARIWEASTGNELVRLKHEEGVQEAIFSPDGRYLVTVDDGNVAHIWLWQPEDLIAEARSRLNRNLTVEEWEQYIGDEPYHQTRPDLSPDVPPAPGEAVLNLPSSKPYIYIAKGNDYRVQGKVGQVYEIDNELPSIGHGRKSYLTSEEEGYDIEVGADCGSISGSIVRTEDGNYGLRLDYDTNPGPRVNEYHLKKHQNYPLQDGDRLQFGKTVLVFVKR